jgi:hypothetical protein
MLARIMTGLMVATLAGGLLVTDAQARGGGGGGGHGGGGGGHGGGFGGGHVGGFGGARVGGFGGAHMGSFGGARMGGHFAGTHMGTGFAREFHGGHRHRGLSPGYAYDDGYGLDCSPYWQDSWQWPSSCY